MYQLEFFAPAGDGRAGAIQRAIDEAFGLGVEALEAVLFTPLFATRGSASSVELVDTVEELEALVLELERDALAVDDAKLTLTIPASAIDEAQAAQLEREFEAAIVPTAPKGTRKLEVVRSEDATESTLVGVTDGIPIVVLWLVLGAVFFTLRMRFISVRGFRHAIEVVRGRYDRPEEEGEVTHFQALASALSATVGLGNIAGVALAVMLGGPGAVFWMVLAGFVGMSSKFVECTLGQVYRRKQADGHMLGGPMVYLDDGLAALGLPRLGKVLAVSFAVMCVGASFGGSNTFQVSQSLGIVRSQVPLFDAMPWLYGLLIAAAVGVVILGGIGRIAKTAEKIVPLMCGLYVSVCLFILISNLGAIPEAFSRIVTEAFTPMAGFGGFMGVLVTGVRRAAFSNEAGVGSAAIAHSAAKTEYPIREGMVALLEPFIDTIVVCTMTGLVIVVTGAFEDPANYDLLRAGQGAALTARAMGGEVSWFPWVLMVAVVLFAYSTMISWSYYGERCCVYLLGDWVAVPYRITFVVFAFLGSIVTASKLVTFGDLMILAMSFPNILGLLLLSGVVKRQLDEYMVELRRGEFHKGKPRP